ncbi:hypothetical protein [Prauserella cavernicola]|uniref:Uncharacterized protein n=1 Tax=Prauserella cavernicola TaxID=2800127 RepID=A0A934QR03_9PSEU|nr:hypothetical protein [Prauserella cavernicola]MBK1783809.1 hypothetical protein [Prauserella cavernicola]
MRWAMLYARSRQVPAAVASVLVSTALVAVAARTGWSLLPVTLALTVAIAVAATGLHGARR